jgi:uncharacterized protein YceH (UPF0502 family)
MSEPTPSAAETPATWPVLGAHERRVLGVLVEKAKTTPDAYPLSLNSLVTGSNQKSNRDPVLNLADFQVEEALTGAQKKGLVMKITGGRVERWRHLLYETWHVDKVELAILAELLLRGPQTEGELRARACRMEPIADLEALRAVLKLLSERRLVVYLTPEGRRGTTLTHGFHAPEELERLRVKHGKDAEQAAEVENFVLAPQADPSPNPEHTSATGARVSELQAEVSALKAALAVLEDKFAGVSEQVRQIKDGLGI